MDRTSFSGRIPPFKNDRHSLIILTHPILQFDQLNLKFAQVQFIAQGSIDLRGLWGLLFQQLEQLAFLLGYDSPQTLVTVCDRYRRENRGRFTQLVSNA